MSAADRGRWPSAPRGRGGERGTRAANLEDRRRKLDAAPGPGEPPRRGRRPGYSLEQIVATAITLLDEQGEQALTFRSLAVRMGAGVGSLYWYVASKEELLDRATDAVLREVVAATTVLPDDPYAALLALSEAFYGAMQLHPWVAGYLMRDVGMQPASMELFERFGQQSLKLDLSSQQRFYAVTALISFAVGVGAEMRQPREVLSGEMDPDVALEAYAARWRALDPATFPFVQSVADDFERHHDIEQFRAGVELILAGIRAQVG